MKQLPHASPDFLKLNPAINQPVDVRAEARDFLDAVDNERELQSLCEHELTRRNIPYLHLSPKAREKIGWPDLVFPVSGRFVSVELKAKQGKVSKEQEAILARFRDLGCVAEVVRSYERFREILEGK